MVTVGMDRVHFKLPIHLHHLISIRARVCRVQYVRCLSITHSFVALDGMS